MNLENIVPYVPTQWVNEITKLNATNLNHIEQGIKNNQDDIIDLAEEISHITGNIYTSVEVGNSITTMGELRTYIEALNTQGKHALFDFHLYKSDAYVCTVYMFTDQDSNYCYIFDLLNGKVYNDYAGYTDGTLIEDYVNNDNDIMHTVNIKDIDTTLGQIYAKLNIINALSNHVLFDVAALESNAYLCTIFIDGVNYKVFDLVTGRVATGAYSANTKLVTVLQNMTQYATINGTYNDMTVGNAKNLISNEGLYISDIFASRTTANGAIIQNASTALLDSVKGVSSIPTHYEKSFTYDQDEVARVTLDVNESTFGAKVINSGTYNFTYGLEGWTLLNIASIVDLLEYGVNLSANPVVGDRFSVVYLSTAAEGSRIQSTVYYQVPRVGITINDVTFIAVLTAHSLASGTYQCRWSQIDTESKWKLVLGSSTLYFTSAELGFTINGTLLVGDIVNVYYVAKDYGTITSTLPVKFRSTNSAVSLVSEITIPTKDASNNDLPYIALGGIPGFYNTRDEIDFVNKKYIKRIERVAYTAENLAATIASGVEYIYDNNWIYRGCTVSEIALSSSLTRNFTAYLNGVESFVNALNVATTTGASTEYGENLTDKLRENVLTISQQTLTTEQKAQVLANLGLVDATNTPF